MSGCSTGAGATNQTPLWLLLIPLFAFGAMRRRRAAATALALAVAPLACGGIPFDLNEGHLVKQRPVDGALRGGPESAAECVPDAPEGRLAESALDERNPLPPERQPRMAPGEPSPEALGPGTSPAPPAESAPGDPRQ